MIEFGKSWCPLTSSLGASSLFRGCGEKSRASGTRKETFFRLLSGIAWHATRNAGLSRRLTDDGFSSLIIVSDFRYKALGLTEAGHTWKLFFKIFCFLEPESVEPDSVEYGFLYEQVRLSEVSLSVLTFVICWVYTS